jgi:sarcosine oxidase, subunit gamma
MLDEALAGNEIAIRRPPGRACINIRGDGSDPRFLRAIAGAADVALPLAPCTSISGLLASMLWLGPDEWLLVSETQAATDLAAGLGRALAGLHAAVTDVSDALIVYALRGSNARAVLAKGCPIDLHPRNFAPAQCARSLLAKAPVLIHLRADEPVFELYLARSYAHYAWVWLLAAAREFMAADEASRMTEW